jgi:hypothetical protein
MERSLPSRRRKKPDPDPGKLIRVSKLVYEKMNKNCEAQSWDCHLRRMLGLPTRKGKEQPLIQGILELHSGLLFLRTDANTWAEIEAIARTCARRNAELNKTSIKWPIRMREIR